MAKAQAPGRSFFRANRSEVIAVPRSMIASAKRINLTSRPAKATRDVTSQKWQEEVWGLYDLVPEFRYGCNWVGNILSRARLVIHYNGNPVDEKDAKHADAVGILADLYGGAEGQVEMLRQVGIHFTAVGETFIVGWVEDNEQRWEISSAADLRQRGDDYELDGEVLPRESTAIIRLWRPHPKKRREADAPARALLPTLVQLHRFNQHIAAQTDSRLVSAGVFIVPTEIEFATATTTNDDEESQDTNSPAQDLMQNFIDTAMEALEDRESAAALVPMVLQMPGEYIDKVRHITFWSDFDEKIGEMQDKARGRLAVGMDMPPEILTGTGELNHWNAWQVEEASIKAHIEPLLQIITSSITRGLLRDLLEAEGVPDAHLYTIEADTTDIRLRPNRSREALELHDRGRLSTAALLRENGFDPDKDAPDAEEVRQWFLQKTALGSPTPEMVGSALEKLGVVKVPRVDPTDGIRPNEAPTLRDHPDRAPDPDQIREAAVVATGEALVMRALERAGNRIKTRFSLSGVSGMAAELYLHAPDMTASDIDFLLEDSFSTVPRFAEQYGIDAGAFAAGLESCTRMLLASRAPLGPGVVEQFIRGAVLRDLVS